MTETETLKVKVGPHEFEATGSAESVREKFQAFRELVALMPNPAVAQAQNSEDTMKMSDGATTQVRKVNPTDAELSKIMRVEDREVALTARPQVLVDAILLLVFGQKVLRQNDAVTGGELISGLKSTGGYSFERIDRTLEKLARDGDLLTFGEHRGKKYRLTATGLGKARALAVELISSVA